MIAGETNEPSVTSSLLGGDEAVADVVVDSLPEKVALDWHNISCSIYKVQQIGCLKAAGWAYTLCCVC